MSPFVMMVFLQAAPIAGAASTGDSAAWQLAAAAALGYVTQLVRAVDKIPNWASYALIGVAGSLIYWFFNRTGVGGEDWGAGLVMFLLATRGTASTVSEAKMAPKTNSL